MVKIDTHIHLVASGCQCSECFLSPSLNTRYTVRLMKFLHGISDVEMQTILDESWPARVSAMVHDSLVDYGVVLGFDGVYEQHTLNYSKSQLIIPDEWVYLVCRKYPNLLPGPSINPFAKDSLERLEVAIHNRAALIKWLPSVQNFDPSDEHIFPFYERLRDSRIPLLSHCGGERTFSSLTPHFNHIRLLEPALKMGVKVICAHSATKILGSSEVDQSDDLKDMLRRYENLWVDNSGLCNPARFHHVPKLAKDTLIKERTLYGSDYPVPSHAYYYVKQLGLKRVLELEREKNWITKDILIKQMLGYDEPSLSRAEYVLRLT